MNECPCCSQRMLRHVRHSKIYWFCPSCWQEMPNLQKYADVLHAFNQLPKVRLKEAEQLSLIDKN